MPNLAQNGNRHTHLLTVPALRNVTKEPGRCPRRPPIASGVAGVLTVRTSAH
jgi:hypothetical protein